MTSPLRRVVLWSLAFLVGGAAIASATAGMEHGAGFAAGGAAVLVGLAVSSFLSHLWLENPRSTSGALAKLALACKLPLLLLAIGWLFTMFPVLSVVLGATVLVAAIVADALTPRGVEA
jgi:hypothetical protein